VCVCVFKNTPQIPTFCMWGCMRGGVPEQVCARIQIRNSIHRHIGRQEKGAGRAGAASAGPGACTYDDDAFFVPLNT